jgi:hypothetical protein
MRQAAALVLLGLLASCGPPAQAGQPATLPAGAPAASSSGPSASAAPRNINPRKVEAAIAKGLAAKGVALKSLECPANRPLAADDMFDCPARDEDDKPLVFHARQTDDKGNVDWLMDGLIIDETKVGDSIEAQVGLAADIKCAARTLIMKIGESFTCSVVIDGRIRTVDITLKNAGGDVAWKLR